MKLSSVKRLLEFDAIIGMILFGSFVMAMPLDDPDYFWHLKNGEIVISAGALFEQDTFSHTAVGNPLQVHGWLFDVTIAYLREHYGNHGIRLLSAFFVSMTWLGIYKCTALFIPRRETCALLGLAGIVLLSPLIAVRPNLFTHLAVIWTLFCLLSFIMTDRKIYLLALIPVFSVWPNLHYGFPVALVLMALFIAGAVMERISPSSTSWSPINILKPIPILIFFACALVVVTNPYGLQIYPELLHMSIRGASSSVSEWQSPNFRIIYAKLVLGSVICYLVVLYLAGRRASWLMIIVPSTMLIVMLIAQRNQAYWALVLPVFVAYGVGELLAQQAETSGRVSYRYFQHTPHTRTAYYVNAAILIVCVVAAVIFAFGVENKKGMENSASSPKLAVNFMLENIPNGKLFNRYDSGGYLIWRTHPKFPVFVDGRYFPYSEKTIKTAIHIMAGLPGSIELLIENNVEIALVGSNTALSEILFLSKIFRPVYSDAGHTIYVFNKEKFAMLRTVERTTIRSEIQK